MGIEGGGGPKLAPLGVAVGLLGTFFCASAARARARCNAAWNWNGLSHEGGAPAQMAFVVFTTPQVPLRGPPIPTSALWAVFQSYHHKQLHSGGCATRPRHVADGTCSASQARPFSSCCHQLGCVLLLCVLCS